ncbi:hypothetical protein PanWU01x14_203760 [Parasponia andersonii]|uniref:Uncharacterized protein n=1 Tax=Parasponia andersonii TaxID=3476 RepID=A0A2P5BWU6_PARAD|nr:hypothetical protein PanWU01x14_203760 [Parasponia andersonii]
MQLSVVITKANSSSKLTVERKTHFGAGDARCSKNSQGGRIFDNGMPVSKIPFIHLTWFIRSSKSTIAASIVSEHINFRGMYPSILIFFEDPPSSNLSFSTVVSPISFDVDLTCEFESLSEQPVLPMPLLFANATAGVCISFSVVAAKGCFLISSNLSRGCDELDEARETNED